MDLLDELDCILSPNSANAVRAVAQREAELAAQGNARIRAERINAAVAALPQNRFTRFNLTAVKLGATRLAKFADRQASAQAMWKAAQAEAARLRTKCERKATAAVDSTPSVPLSLELLRSRGLAPLHTV